MTKPAKRRGVFAGVVTVTAIVAAAWGMWRYSHPSQLDCYDFQCSRDTTVVLIGGLISMLVVLTAWLVLYVVYKIVQERTLNASAVAVLVSTLVIFAVALAFLHSTLPS